MTPRTSLRYWLSVFVILTLTSLGIALWLTRPGDDRDRTLAVLAYVANPQLDRPDAELTAPVVLALADSDAAAFRVEFRPRRVPDVAVIAFSDARDCQPKNDIDGSSSPLPGDVLRADVGPAAYAAPLSAFVLKLGVTDATFVCKLAHGAAHRAFSGRSFELAASPRFIDIASGADADRGCIFVQVNARRERLCPVTTYDLNYAPLLDSEIFRISGGKAAGREDDREIASDAALVRLDWRDEAADHWRELFLFVAAGIFALGLSALLEAAKAFFEIRAGESEESPEP